MNAFRQQKHLTDLRAAATRHQRRLGQPITIWVHPHATSLTLRSALQRFFTLSVLNILGSGIFFLIQTHIANIIGRAQFGMLAYGIAFGIYGQMIVVYGQDRSLVRDLVQRPHFIDMVIGSLCLRTLLLGIVISVLLLWRVFIPAAMSWSVIIIILAYTLKSLDLQAVYDTWQKMGRHAAYLLLQRALYAAVICLLLYVLQVKLTLTIIGVVLLASQIIYLIIQHSWVFRQLPRQAIRSISWYEVRSQAQRGSWLCMSGLLSLSQVSLNQILIKHYADARSLGGYAAAWQITMITTLFIQFAARVGGPRLASVTHETSDYHEQLRFLLRYSLLTLLLVLPIAGVLMFFPSRVMGLLYSAEYHQEARILYPMGLYTLLLAPGVVCEQFIVFSRMEWVYLLAMLLSGLTCVFVGMVAIPHAGGYGAAWGLVACYSVAMGVYLAAIIRHLRRVRHAESVPQPATLSP